jgi:hypothetical protein
VGPTGLKIAGASALGHVPMFRLFRSWVLGDNLNNLHQRHIRLEQPDNSAVAEYCIDSGHRILFHDISILAIKPDTWIALLGRLLRLSPSQQYEQRSWFLSQRVMEASHFLPQEISATWCLYLLRGLLSGTPAARLLCDAVCPLCAVF